MTPDILRRIVSVDPRAVAASLLTYLIEAHGARGGVVFALRKGGLAAFVEMTSLQGLGLGMKLWDENLAGLTAREKAVDGDTCILPLERDGLLVGGVWLDGVDARVCELGDLATPIALALQAPTLPLDAGMNMDPEEFLKRKTILLLNENEWNVARVARIMKCTRRTIYLRLDRWEIPRKKISKSPRRAARTDPAGA